MIGEERRESTMATPRVKRLVLMALVLLGVLPLPLIAYALGAYVVTRTGGGAPAWHLLSSQLLLLSIALVAGLGGLLVWSTASSLERATVVGVGGLLEEPDGGRLERLQQSGLVTNSVTRMLTTIERQASELSHFAQRLDSTNRELESASARLQEVSFTDEGTRLYNRRFFSVRLEEEVARHHRFGHPLSLVLFDLDGFKALNDELGRRAGDETLRGIADVLVKSSRDIDVICRYGGDEFAILLVETPRAGARPYAQRIRDILSASSSSHGQPVTASFGVASLAEDAATGDAIVRAADEALSAAKRAGTNCVAVWEELRLGPAAEPEAPAPRA